MAFVDNVLHAMTGPQGWKKLGPAQEYRVVTLKATSPEYAYVADLLSDSSGGDLQACCVKRVQNPFLWGCYQLQKAQLNLKENLYETELFRAVTNDDIPYVVKRNFDCRLQDSDYERGVVFAQDPHDTIRDCGEDHDGDAGPEYYDTDTDECPIDGSIFLAKVLVNEDPFIVEDFFLPSDLEKGRKYGTLQNCDKSLIVKYNSNEYYPAYLIEYYKSGL